MERDPVCGMEIDPKKAVATLQYEGAVYHFCSKNCADQFQAQPELYADKRTAPRDDCR